MFGKRVSEYLRFQWVFLVLIVVVGLARLALSLAGLPVTTVRWVSINAVAWAGVLYYGVVVHTSGFGSYKQLLPLGLFQTLAFQVVPVVGILLAIAGHANVFAASEYSLGATSQWKHLAAHLTIGMVVPPLASWAVSSLVMLITKKLAPRPAFA